MRIEIKFGEYTLICQNGDINATDKEGKDVSFRPKRGRENNEPGAIIYDALLQLGQDIQANLE